MEATLRTLIETVHRIPSIQMSFYPSFRRRIAIAIANKAGFASEPAVAFSIHPRCAFRCRHSSNLFSALRDGALP